MPPRNGVFRDLGKLEAQVEGLLVTQNRIIGEIASLRESIDNHLGSQESRIRAIESWQSQHNGRCRARQKMLVVWGAMGGVVVAVADLLIRVVLSR